MILSFIVLVEAPNLASAGKWSDDVMVSIENDVAVSYRQQLQKDGWFAEWKVENKSTEWVEPFV